MLSEVGETVLGSVAAPVVQLAMVTSNKMSAACWKLHIAEQGYIFALGMRGLMGPACGDAEVNILQSTGAPGSLCFNTVFAYIVVPGCPTELIILSSTECLTILPSTYGHPKLIENTAHKNTSSRER